VFDPVTVPLAATGSTVAMSDAVAAATFEIRIVK
jgi:hypothetical protein